MIGITENFDLFAGVTMIIVLILWPLVFAFRQKRIRKARKIL